MSKLNELFEQKLHVVNFGIESFYDDLAEPEGGRGACGLEARRGRRQGRRREPASNCKKPNLRQRSTRPNKEALHRILAAQPTIIGLGIAGEVIPGMTKKTILHAGPPVTWARMSGPQRGAVMGGLIYEGLARERTSRGGGGARRERRNRV